VTEAIQAAESDRKFGLRTMKSLRKSSLLSAVLLLALAVSLTRLGAQAPEQSPAPPAAPQGQQPAPQQGAPTRIVIPVNQVVVPVTVKDGSGHLVPDLRRDEFRIFEDNIEQKISYFSVEVFPLSMVVLIDNDLKSKDEKQVAESLRAIVAGLSLNDETFVCRFDQFFHQGQGFITDQDKLLTELKRTQLDSEPSVSPSSPAFSNAPSINGHSATGDAPSVGAATMNIKGQPTKALDDAVYNAAQLLKDRGRDRRKIIFLISDGVNGPKFNTYNYSTTLKELLRYNISVYAVGVGSAYFDRKFERLSKYAHDTGGDVFYGLKSRAMEELYSRVTEQARNEYTLAYAPAGTDRGAEYHSIEVRVKRDGLTILTREGYYAGATPR
jgi:Ca-activated chloride channel family protein